MCQTVFCFKFVSKYIKKKKIPRLNEIRLNVERLRMKFVLYVCRQLLAANVNRYDKKRFYYTVTKKNMFFVRTEGT